MTTSRCIFVTLHRLRRHVAPFAMAISCLASCKTDEEKLFTRIDPGDSGITFINENTETEKSNILTYEYFYNGGGVAIGDINNDGLSDIYFTSTIYENKLYLNKGNFEFEDITAQSGTACEVGWKTGTAMVDINADGFLDIYVCRSASPNPERRKNMLLINNGNNTFTDRAREYNLDDDSYSTQAAFFDFDRDGDLDALMLNHSILEISNSFLITRRNSKTRYPHVGNRFLVNEGGKFRDVSDSVGVFGPASNYGLGVSLSDVNNDGWIDIYTGCDYTGRDKLLLNQNGQYFLDATDTLSHISKFTMGTDIADVNGDGFMDIFTVDMLPADNHRQKQLFGSDRYDVYNNMVENGLHSQYMRNMLHLNNGNGTFSEIGQLAGVANTDWSWGALFADYDNDGNLDLFITNGFKRDLTDNDFAKFKAAEDIRQAQRAGKNASFLEVINGLHENKIPNYAFRGGSELTFSDVTDAWGLGGASLTNGVAYGDLDNDGDLDLVTNNINDPAGVYRNNSEKGKNNFLTVRLRGSSGNKMAVGAKVTLYASGKKLVRENLPVRGFQSTVQPQLHFGLGAVDRIDSLAVAWPDGTYQALTGTIKLNEILTITQAHATRKEIKTTPTKAYFTKSSDLFNHRENDFIDFRVQPLMHRMYSAEGPAAAAADINGDGITDLFFGGARGQASEIWLGAKNGTYLKTKQDIFGNTKGSETTDAVFFDADGDRDQDLFVVTGGYEFAEGDAMLADHLYINNGQGRFAPVALPELLSNGACVAPNDFDGDGDIDLFIGGKVESGKYPDAPESVMLVNDGKAKFSIGDDLPETLKRAGIVSDAAWTDLNKDGVADLVVVGEWMAVKVFINNKGKLVDQSSQFFEQSTDGLWNCVAAADLDGDGDEDLVLGNQGLNTQMAASVQQPVTLVYGDFDKNGSVDPIVSYYVQGKSYPYPTRDELTEQVPSFKKRFTSYSSYADAGIEDVLNPEELTGARQLRITNLSSVIARNDNGKFVLASMPVQAQVAPICSIAIADIDGDKIPDIVTGGNLSATRARTGKMTGNCGFVFRGDGTGNFEFMPPVQSGIAVDGDTKKVIVVNGALLFVVNDGPAQLYKPTN